jgi:tetratricopeptide (TPR) repeat protein
MGKASQREAKQRTRLHPILETNIAQQHKPLSGFLLLAVLASLIYSNTFSAPFVFDDINNIVENPRIKDLKNFLDFSGTRYIGFLSFALNYYFNGLELFGYHLVNLAIHTINAFLVYLFVRLILRTPLVEQNEPVGTDRASWIPLATALLFVAHPIQTQAVTYIVQRFASLATLFYLLATVSYLKWKFIMTSEKHHPLWYTTALVSTVLAMKTKEISFTLPIVIVLIEVIFFRAGIKKWSSLAPFLLTLLIIPLSRIDAVGEAEARFAQETAEISRKDYLLTQFRVIVTYIRLLLIPANQNLDYDYSISHSFIEPSVFLSFFSLFVLLGSAVYFLFLSRSPLVNARLWAFGVLWFFLSLSVESSIIPIRDVIFEHRLYLSSPGFFLSYVITILSVLQRLGFRGRERKPMLYFSESRLFILFFSFVISLLSITAYRRNLIWSDSLSLWGDVVKKAPSKARAHNNLGEALDKLGRVEEAAAHYSKSIELNPEYETAHYNLGTLLEKQEKFDEAIAHYSRTLLINSSFGKAHNNLGVVLQKQGKFDEAAAHYSQALLINPNDEVANANLGVTLANQGKPEEAIEHFRSALGVNPNFGPAHIGLGNTLIMQKKIPEGIVHYSEALMINPNDEKAHYALAEVLYNQGKVAEAFAHYSEVLQIRPNDERVHYNLGSILAADGEFDQAISHFSQAVKINPNLEMAHNNLGVIFDKHGKLEEAALHFSQAVRINPGFAKAHNNLGAVLARQGKFKEAAVHFSEAIKSNPRYPEAHYSLGLAYYQLGRRQAAINEFKTALEMNPQFFEAREYLKSIDRKTF